MRLSFLNANWYRQYPFRGDTSLYSLAGLTLPNDVLVGARLMADHTTCPTGVQVSKLYHNAGNIVIELSSLSGEVLGVASGVVATDNQSLAVKAVVPTFSGFVVVGNPAQLQTQCCYNFGSSSAVLEPSTITFYTPPAIRGLTHNNQRITGQANFDSSSLVMTVTGENINFNVLKPTDVSSREDRTARLLTCANPVIAGINSVSPTPSASGLNIDLYGISPVTISVNADGVTVGSSLALSDVCKPVNIPPTDNTDESPYDITTTETVEWQTWPQYNI